MGDEDGAPEREVDPEPGMAWEARKEFRSREGEEPEPESAWEATKGGRSGEVEQGSVRSRHRSLCDT